MMQKIILIGYMGSGKTTLGKKISELLSIPFIDSDFEIEKITKNSISELFEKIGESSFRNLETEFIEKLDFNSHFVLSTGGGMPCFNDNMEFLNKLGFTIYLKNSSDVLAERLFLEGEKRPLILGKSKAELIKYIDDTISIREKYYSKSRVILSPENQNIESILIELKNFKLY